MIGESSLSKIKPQSDEAHSITFVYAFYKIFCISSEGILLSFKRPGLTFQGKGFPFKPNILYESKASLNASNITFQYKNLINNEYNNKK